LQGVGIKVPRAEHPATGQRLGGWAYFANSSHQPDPTSSTIQRRPQFGGVAMALHQRQAAIILLASSSQAARLEVGGGHGSGGGKAHPQALTGGAVALTQVRHRQG